MEYCCENVTVVDATPPAIACPADLVLTCASRHASTSLTSLSDNCSADVAPTASCVDPHGRLLDLGDIDPATLDPDNLVTCTATDGGGNTASCSFEITIDPGPPVITPVSAPIVLWPPNHRYVTIDVATQ